GRRDLRHIELIVDVAVHPESLVVQRTNRLAGKLERNRHVPQPLPGLRLSDDRALVADHALVEPRLTGGGTHGPAHPAGNEDHVDAGTPDACDRLACAWPQHHVLADQRPVEVARDGLEVAREIRRKIQPAGFVRKSTSAWMSDAGKDLYFVGI